MQLEVDVAVIAFVNGKYLPDDKAVISIFDRGVMMGDAVFDTTRTFAGSPFRLDDHLARLRRSLNYIELDGDAIIPQVREATNQVIAKSRTEIELAGDVWVTQIVTRGQLVAGGADWRWGSSPTVIVMLRRIDFSAFGLLYEQGGVDLTVSMLTRHFSGPIDPRVKATSRLAAVRAELKAARHRQVTGRLARTVVFNDDGSIAETYGANMCIVKDGHLLFPPQILEGISLKTVCELVQELGLHVEERKITLYDLLDADETWITTTSFSVLPIVTIDGIALPGRGEIYPRLLKAWVQLVGFDFVGQARERATGATAGQPSQV